MNTYQIISFLSASVVLTLLPGPDILYVLTQSITSGWRSGVAVALGLCSGLVIHTSAVALGVAALLTQYPVALTGIKIFGACYLAYLAYTSFRETGLNLNEQTENKTYRKLFKTGFIMNVLNPKVLLFFFAFLPQFLVDGTSPSLQVVVLGIVFFAQALAVFSLVARFAGMLNHRVMSSPINRHIGKIKSAVYLLIAINLFII